MSHVYRRHPLLMRDHVSSMNVLMVSNESHKEDSDFERRARTRGNFGGDFVMCYVHGCTTTHAFRGLPDPDGTERGRARDTGFCPRTSDVYRTGMTRCSLLVLRKT
jgi:hypothetical protein